MFALWVEEDGRFAFAEQDNGGVSIDDDVYRELFAGQERGLQIVKGADGLPTLGEQSHPPEHIRLELLLRQKAAKVETATSRIVPLQDAVDLGIASAAETAALTEWKRYRVELNGLDVTTEPVEWPEEPGQ
ncbi:tail fiber assembly protein [Cupriavidus gilardii]|uniref:tail fiber assembly protein n=1 Tax=Cupriavidus gilardii TaxID=82541 RepID=UPI001ABEA768|nr:tail fiber assembly protein [Cupriavidus gilardii]MBO4119826.1 tail fiber assembly protein [Cupriavidus gilardii]